MGVWLAVDRWMKLSAASSGVAGRVGGRGLGGGASRILYQKVGADILLWRGRLVVVSECLFTSRLDCVSTSVAAAAVSSLTEWAVGLCPFADLRLRLLGESNSKHSTTY